MTDPPKGYLARGHHKVRLLDLEEFFVARWLILCAEHQTKNPVTFCVADLFARFSREAFAVKLEAASVETSDRPTEKVVDFLNVHFGANLEEKTVKKQATDFYNEWLEHRLRNLKNGDGYDLKPSITDYAVERETNNGQVLFAVEFDPVVLTESVRTGLPQFLELPSRLLRESAGKVPHHGVRIDYRRQRDSVVEYLENRQKETGERHIAFTHKDYPFRHLMAHTSGPGGNLLMEGLGTTTASDRVLLPILLECAGYLDLNSMAIDSDPLNIADITVAYTITLPSVKNTFGAQSQGLTAEQRCKLTETELFEYNRVHNVLRRAHVFTGRPKLESSFAEAMAWFLRKISYCLEEPSFMREPARAWRNQHRKDSYEQMEDEFFLPRLFERMKEGFGPRVSKKPEAFGGEIDIFFDDIPIELKVRKDYSGALTSELMTSGVFPPGGQAAAYAATSRLGLVAVLDLPMGADSTLTNLSQCVGVIRRDMRKDDDYPTCIVGLVFHCHHPKPSSVRVAGHP